jgi:hypothetical protein
MLKPNQKPAEKNRVNTSYATRSANVHDGGSILRTKGILRRQERQSVTLPRALFRQGYKTPKSKSGVLKTFSPIIKTSKRTARFDSHAASQESYELNGGFMDIMHIGIYTDNCLVIDASFSRGQVVYRNLFDADKQVMFGRLKQ